MDLENSTKCNFFSWNAQIKFMEPINASLSSQKRKYEHRPDNAMALHDPPSLWVKHSHHQTRPLAYAAAFIVVDYWHVEESCSNESPAFERKSTEIDENNPEHPRVSWPSIPEAHPQHVWESLNGRTETSPQQQRMHACCMHADASCGLVDGVHSQHMEYDLYHCC